MAGNVPRIDASASLPVATYASALGAAVSSTVLFAASPGVRVAALDGEGVGRPRGGPTGDVVIMEHVHMVV